jgi:hypothetical protein
MGEFDELLLPARVCDLAARERNTSQLFAAGLCRRRGLMSYGTDQLEMSRQLRFSWLR